MGVSCDNEEDRTEVPDFIPRDVDLRQSSQMEIQNNAVRTIDRLPLELLEKAFITMTRISDTSDAGFPVGWTHISLVCSEWRQIAVNCPHLWTSVWVGNNPEYLSMFLDRSGALPLSVFNSSHERFQDDLPLLRSQMHRVQDFIFTEIPDEEWIRTNEGTVLPNHLYNFLSNLRWSPAPLLQSFCLKTHTLGTSWLGQVLFTKTLQLHTVSLSCCVMPESFATSSLRFLTIINYPPTHRHVMRELLGALKSACNLEHLTIENSFRLVNIAEETKLYFPHLRFLRLICDWYDGADGLMHFYECVHYAIAADALMDFSRIYRRNIHNMLERMGSTIEERLPVRQLSITLRGSTYLAIFSAQNWIDFKVLKDLKGTAVKLPYQSVSSSATLHALCKPLRYPYLQCLRVDRVDLSIKVWIALFSRLTTLTTIHITKENLNLMLAIRQAIIDVAAPLGQAALGFRSLRILILNDWIFSDQVVGLLIAVLRTRASLDHMLPVLRVIRGRWVGITVEEFLESARDLVGEIEVIDNVSDVSVYKFVYL